MQRPSHSPRPRAPFALGLTLLLAACGGGGGGSTPPAQTGTALVWGSGKWGSDRWSATLPARLDPDRASVPADLTDHPTTEPTALETTR